MRNGREDQVMMKNSDLWQYPVSAVFLSNLKDNHMDNFNVTLAVLFIVLITPKALTVTTS